MDQPLLYHAWALPRPGAAGVQLGVRGDITGLLRDVLQAGPRATDSTLSDGNTEHRIGLD